MPDFAALGLVGGAVFGLRLVARAIRRRSEAPSVSFRASPSGLRLAGVAAGVVWGTAIALLGTLTAAPLHWSSAAVAAFGAMAGAAVAREIDRGVGNVHYALPRGRVVEGGAPGSASAPAIVAALAAAAIVAVIADTVRLVDAGDAGLVLIGATVGTLGERWLDGAWNRGALRQYPIAVLSATLAAAVAAALVIFLP